MGWMSAENTQGTQEVWASRANLKGTGRFVFAYIIIIITIIGIVSTILNSS